MTTRKLTSAFLVITILLCLAAPLPLPYGYYVSLKLVMCAVCLWCYFHAAASRRSGTIAKTFIVLIVLYNPIIMLPLGREIWSVVNLATVVFLIICLLQQRRRG